MFVFSWEGLALGVDLSDFYKLGASLPASLAGTFFPEKNSHFFYIRRPPSGASGCGDPFVTGSIPTGLADVACFRAVVTDRGPVMYFGYFVL